MNDTRKIRKIFKSLPTIEGAGVHLRRAFRFDEVPLFDPFLMLDDFRGDKGGDPPRRRPVDGGGRRHHPPGDAKRRPQGPNGRIPAWANLPPAQKMLNPRYRDVKAAQIPVAVLKDGVQVRVICGDVEGLKGPVQDIVIDPQYLGSLRPARLRVRPCREARAHGTCLCFRRQRPI